MRWLGREPHALVDLQRTPYIQYTTDPTYTVYYTVYSISYFHVYVGSTTDPICTVDYTVVTGIFDDTV